MNTLIKPTIGRKVWFWLNGTHIGAPAAAQPQSQDPAQAMDATIVLVHSEHRVNLLVVDHAGLSWPVCSVFLQQEGDETQGGMHAQWMPYQTGQAQKDAAEKMQQAATSEALGTTSSRAQGNVSYGHEDRNPRRNDLIRDLVIAAGPVLAASPHQAGHIGNGIVDMVDAVLNPVPRATPAAVSHASAVLYPAIKAAMAELEALHPGFNYAVNRAFNHLHRAFWSEVPAPVSAVPLRPEIVSAQQTLKDPA